MILSATEYILLMLWLVSAPLKDKAMLLIITVQRVDLNDVTSDKTHFGLIYVQ